MKNNTPPHILVDARQDTVHKDSGTGRAAKMKKTQIWSNTLPGLYTFDEALALPKAALNAFCGKPPKGHTWCIPTKEEFQLAFKANIIKPTQKWFWSSSSAFDIYAWKFDGSSGDVVDVGRLSRGAVRCIARPKENNLNCSERF